MHAPLKRGNAVQYRAGAPVFGVWESLAIRTAWDGEILGSNPSTPTIFRGRLVLAAARESCKLEGPVRIRHCPP